MHNDKPQMLGEHNLNNGRRYLVTDTGKPYLNGEYPSGGYLIQVWSKHLKEWTYIDNSPDLDCVANFLKAAERLPKR